MTYCLTVYVNECRSWAGTNEDPMSINSISDT